jgi:Tfp pilus assembly protein PilV
MFAEPRNGSTFIEVLLSLVLLAIAGTALVTLLGQTAHAIQNVRESEAQTRAAGLEVSALARLDRAALIARLGRTGSRGWSMQIDRAAPDLFDVRIAPSDTGLVLIQTTLYRPDSIRHATP